MSLSSFSPCSPVVEDLVSSQSQEQLPQQNVQEASSSLLLPSPSTTTTSLKDRNFDDLKELFQERIYGSIKGQYRFDMVLEDIEDVIQQHEQKKSLVRHRLVDIGGGLGQISLHFACGGGKRQGGPGGSTITENENEVNENYTRWDVHYYDISKEMKQEVDGKWKEATTNNHHNNNFGTLTTNVGGIRHVIDFFERQQQSDSSECVVWLVTVHAVLEWLANPIQNLSSLLDVLPSNTVLSLLYYNYLPCEKKKKQSKMATTASMDKFGVVTRHTGKINKLTPFHEFEAHHLENFIISSGRWRIVKRAGIRINKFPRHGTHEELLKYLDEERQIARTEPYCRQGRYNHIVAMKH